MSDNAGDFDERKIAYLNEFFTQKDYKINLAQYVAKDEIKLDFTENGIEKSLVFNLSTGESNVRACIEI